MAKPKLFIGYVHPPMIPHYFMECMFAMTQHRGYDTIINPYGSGPLIAPGRNLLVQKFLETSCEYFLSVDTDITWHPSQVDELMARDKDVVSGLYRSHGEKGAVWPVYLNISDDGGFVRPKWSEVKGKTEPFMVGSVGMGFCLIKRKVFEELGASLLYPYAEVGTTDDRYQGEDVTFCARAREKGFEVWLDPAVRVEHWKTQPV